MQLTATGCRGKKIFKIIGDSYIQNYHLVIGDNFIQYYHLVIGDYCFQNYQFWRYMPKY